MCALKRYRKNPINGNGVTFRKGAAVDRFKKNGFVFVFRHLGKSLAKPHPAGHKGTFLQNVGTTQNSYHKREVIQAF